MIKHWEFNNEGWQRIGPCKDCIHICSKCKKLTTCGFEDRDTFLCDECYLEAGKIINSFE